MVTVEADVKRATLSLAERRQPGVLGRNACAQVKIRGFRVELGEVESCLTQLPGVSAVAVCSVASRPAGEEASGGVCTRARWSSRWRRCVGTRAPSSEYMAPAAYVHLAELP